MHANTTGPWDRARVRRHLDEAVIPLRLSCLDARGFPRVTSLWFVWQGEALWCATRATSAVARWLRADPRCGFEVARDEPPYRGVRGRGRGTLVPERGEAVLRTLVRRYLGSEEAPLARWLLARVEGEVALRIEPERLATWDYTARMTGR